MNDATAPPEQTENRVVLNGFRLLGLLLLLLVVVPFYRMVAGADSDRIAADVIEAAETSRTLMLLGTVITLTLGVLLSRVVDAGRLEARLTRVGRWLADIPLIRFAATLALFSTLLTATFSIAVLHGKPNLIDAMVQLTHARYVAAGHLAGPVDSLAEFWHLPNSIVTPNGWVSQYPPGYVVLLGVGLRLGMGVLVGPLLAGVAVFFTTLTAERLLPSDRAAARSGAILVAFSPFLIGLAGSYMNHVAAATFIAIAIYCALRGRDADSIVWAVFCGAAVGAVFSIRPLTAVVAALVVAMIWLAEPPPRRSRISGLLRLSAGAVVGIAPFFAALAAYNQYFFGSPFRFGYAALVGPLVGPGFHRDPSGHMYGPLQALGYTSSDLVTLGMYLLETPIPAVLVVALFLLVSRRFESGVRILVAWAVLPVLANALYWHHGIFMGPRMLNEWAPAWALLTAVAAIGLVRRIPSAKSFGNYSPRAGISLAFLVAWAAAVLYLGPQRLLRYGGSWMASTRMAPPATPGPSLVFVHGGWPTRIAVRLTANGLRGDSLEAAMALNTTCDVHRFAAWYATKPGVRPARKPALNFDFGESGPTGKLDIANGDQIRYSPGTPLPADCLRQIASDTLGIIDISPLLWQTDLPGLASRGAMVVRDMGPDENARLIAREPDRIPMLLFRDTKEGAPRLVPYAAGIKSLWPNG
jgi:Dolichyl-phosphate-mannose-protein mannosyltransferase